MLAVSIALDCGLPKSVVQMMQVLGMLLLKTNQTQPKWAASFLVSFVRFTNDPKDVRGLPNSPYD